MEIGEYIGLKYDTQYTENELGIMFSKFSNLSMGQFYAGYIIISLLSKQNISIIIKFIDMFRDINEFENSRNGYSVAGNIIYAIKIMVNSNHILVYKIMDYMLRMNMNTKMIFVIDKSTRGFDNFYVTKYSCSENYYIVHYMANNFSVIQNVRKIINNYDILLFDITNDLQFIELLLLITKCKEKILPKFIITHKILYYYLLVKNEICNN